MKTTTGYKTTILSLALLLTLGGCVKDELHDTPHPDTGKVTVTADWSDRGEGVDIPAEWTVTMGGYTGTETGATHSPRRTIFSVRAVIPLRCITLPTALR